MLYIKDQRTKDQTVQHQWHVGEPFPSVLGRVVTFQADGDELDLILAALERRTANPLPEQPRTQLLDGCRLALEWLEVQTGNMRRSGEIEWGGFVRRALNMQEVGK